MPKMASWLRRLMGKPAFSYSIADRDLDMWFCEVCWRTVSGRQMTYHAASTHSFNARNVRITNQPSARIRVVPL